MNHSQYEAIKKEIGNVEDNLYRYKLQAKSRPDLTYQDGWSISDTIKHLEEKLVKLKEGLD